MAEELRLALILLGALAIGSVILHGIWTVRRTVNEERKAAKLEAEEKEPEIAPEEQEIQKLKLRQMEMDFATLTQAKDDGQEQGIPVATLNVDSIYNGKAEDISIQEQTEQVEINEEQGSLLSDEIDLEDQNLPSFSSVDLDEPTSVEQTLPELNTEQNEPEALVQNETAQSKTEQKQEVLMLFVDKSEGMPIDGAKLLPTLLTLGFKFGEMDLFHRHQHSSGKGEILFSLANMFNPGTFDIDNMEQLTTRGLTIFMTLPNAAEALQTFNMMHNAAKKIADEFDATVLDDKRRPLDVAIVRSYVERIRKF